MFSHRAATAVAATQGAVCADDELAAGFAGGAFVPDVGASPAESLPFEAAFACLKGMGDARSREVAALEDRRRVLVQQKKELQKEIKNKRQRDRRLMKKAVKDLSDEQLLEVAAARVAARSKAKANSAAMPTASAAAASASNAVVTESLVAEVSGDQHKPLVE